MRTSENLIELVKKNINEFYFEDSFIETHGAEEVDSEGGNEGEGEYCHKIILFKEENIFIKIQASYYSYEGVELDYAEVYEVEPREVVVTQYFKKDGK